jgi:hypothetical protein
MVSTPAARAISKASAIFALLPLVGKGDLSIV